MAVSVLSVGLAGTLEFAAADLCKRAESPAVMRVGLRLTSGDAAGWARMGGKTSGPASRAALLTAARLNPHNSNVWMELGLRAETDGHLKEARGYLNRAIELDRGYLPLWTLANFCVRHGDDGYATLLRQALGVVEVGAQDAAPVFDLAWQASGDAAFISANIVGGDAGALRLYLPYLLERERTSALIAPALALAGSRKIEDRAALLDSCEFLLSKGHEAEALALWNRIGISPLDPSRGDVVTNGALNIPSRLGFDWKFNSAADHPIDFQGEEAGARIEFDGRQPEILELLRESIPVNSGRRYTLRWQAKATESTSPVRMLWVLTANHSDVPFARADIATQTEWTGGKAIVTVPANVHFASLALRIERRVGERRFSGVAWVRKPNMWHAE